MFNLNINTLNFEIAGTKITKRHILLLITVLVFFYGLFQEKIDKYVITHIEKTELTDTIKTPILSRDIFTEYVDDDKVDEFVQLFCDNHKCDYVNVNLFHNGVITESGIHLRKMSCIAEGLRDGKLDLIHRLQDWVIKPFKKKFRVLKKNGYLYIPNLKLDKDPYFRVTIPRMGIESVFYVALYDKRYINKHGEPHFIGFVSYIWGKPTNFDEGELVAMKKEVDRIREFVIDEKKNIR